MSKQTRQNNTTYRSNTVQNLAMPNIPHPSIDLQPINNYYISTLYSKALPKNSTIIPDLNTNLNTFYLLKEIPGTKESDDKKSLVIKK